MTPHGTSEIVAFVVVAAVILLFPVIVLHLILTEMLFFRLRRRFPDYYREIGEPSLFLNNSISRGSSMMRYVWDRDYLAVEDERTRKLGDLSRRMLVMAPVLFGVGVLGFVVLGAVLR